MCLSLSDCVSSKPNKKEGWLSKLLSFCSTENNQNILLEFCNNFNLPPSYTQFRFGIYTGNMNDSLLGDLDFFGAFWIWPLSWNPLLVLSSFHPTTRRSWCWLMQHFSGHDRVCNCTKTHGDPEKNIWEWQIDAVSVFHITIYEGLARANIIYIFKT